jgi:RNA polymerase sigma-70 factor (ECF subfamily)
MPTVNGDTEILPAPEPIPVRSVGLTRPAREADIEGLVLAAYDAHVADLVAFAAAVTRDRPAAEDAVSDAFVKLISETRAGRSPDNVRGWLFTVTGRLLTSRGRRLTVATRFLHHLVNRDVEPGPETLLVRTEVRDDIDQAMRRLTRTERAGLVLAARGFSGREIAQALGKSENATRTLLCRARIKVRSYMTAQSEADR